MKRKLIIMIALVAMLCALALPTYAASTGYNYLDYETGYVVDGNNDIVTVALPLSEFYWKVSVSNSTYSASGTDTSFNFETPAEECYLYVYPFGKPDGAEWNGSYLFTDNIPDDAEFLVNYKVWLDSESNTSRFYRSSWRSVYIDDGALLYGDMINAYGNIATDGVYSYGFNGTFNTSYDGWSGYFDHTISYLSPGEIVYFEFLSVELKLTISSFYRALESSGLTGEIATLKAQLADQGVQLDSLIDEQQQTNEKLDDMINGTVPPAAPPNSDLIADLDDLESGIMDGVNDGMDNVDSAFQIGFDSFVGFAQSLLGCVVLFNLFADIPLIKGLLYISLSFGVVTALFNIGTAIMSHTGKKGGQ